MKKKDYIFNFGNKLKTPRSAAYLRTCTLQKQLTSKCIKMELRN